MEWYLISHKQVEEEEENLDTVLESNAKMDKEI